MALGFQPGKNQEKLRLDGSNLLLVGRYPKKSPRYPTSNQPLENVVPLEEEMMFLGEIGDEF